MFLHSGRGATQQIMGVKNPHPSTLTPFTSRTFPLADLVPCNSFPALPVVLAGRYRTSLLVARLPLLENCSPNLTRYFHALSVVAYQPSLRTWHSAEHPSYSINLLCLVDQRKKSVQVSLQA